MGTRLVVMASLATLWGIRLTFNFARKGAYKLRFWEGVEDYRWAVVRSGAPFNNNRWAWTAFDLGFIIWETIADEQQWAFQTKKWAMLHEGKQLEELPAPYDKGFNTIGLWSCSRHPNYFAEQAVWMCFYLFSIGAGMGVANWSLIGALLLIVLFQGSSSLAEEISGGKYPEYEKYRQSVPRFFPGKKYQS